MCLLSESRKVLGVNGVNIGAVLQDLQLILLGEVIISMLEIFPSAYEMS
jgi:hypothetical protein